jgi:hypothetical protein
MIREKYFPHCPHINSACGQWKSFVFSLSKSNHQLIRSLSYITVAKMRSSICICLCAILLPAVFAGRLDYPAPSASTSSYSAPAAAASASDGYQMATDSYAAKDDGYGAKVQCTPYFDTVFTEQCEDYSDRVCRTNHKEDCRDIPDKNCRAVVSSRQVRKCFNVTELVCKLREDVKYEVVQVGFTVQKCHKVSGELIFISCKKHFNISLLFQSASAIPCTTPPLTLRTTSSALAC